MGAGFENAAEVLQIGTSTVIKKIKKKSQENSECISFSAIAVMEVN